jgi:uncharacterized protein (DUF488 family)
MHGTIFTVGHSNHSPEDFLALLKRHEIACLCDVRSSPFSRLPQFHQHSLMRDLKDAGIAYLFLGDELGARSKDPSCYDHGKVRYDRLSQTDLFRGGIDRLLSEAALSRIALMCAEKDPLDCHRSILIAPQILAAGFDVQHILPCGSLESHADALGRLRRQLDLPEYDLFRTAEDVIEDACRIQAGRIAWTAAPDTGHATRAAAG